MSIRPSSSASRSRANGDYRDIRVDNKPAVKALIYFSGRNPRKTKSIRRYYDEDFDARSTGSGGSVFSWSSGTSSVCFVESTNPYWYWDEAADSALYPPSPSRSSRKHKSSKKARSSHNHRTTQPTPTGSTWGPRPATVENDDYDDDDSSSSSGSSDWSDDYADQQPGAPFQPHPGMMPPPPPGAYHHQQPMYGGGMPYSHHAMPHPGMAPNGFPMQPPPPPMGMPPQQSPPPPPPGGHFVADKAGIQVFVDG
ncbi:hypothetical protein N658DRAFT_503353 [Parathielavia hyrcaniae]|uniref:Uncharacterized protein n=1 Tax=Parathielavia hyrcaniae TaxID=113614 RepID=A0AAN6Q7T5_9PEZI|nr:hypothetical protein N658DRAFT_503353 [Parathielavia hyrcaniae]